MSSTLLGVLLMAGGGASLAGRPLAAQLLSGSLFGTVLDPAAEPLVGVRVVLRLAGHDVVEASTDAKGRVRFLSLEPGTYELRAEREGFVPAEYPSVGISPGRGTVVQVSMSPTPGETVTVTAEPPAAGGIAFSPHLILQRRELEVLPSARDPWAIAAQAPGVLLGGVNVGGTESGQQLLLVGPGSTRAQTAFQLDGVTVTDMAVAGASAVYFDFDQFQSVRVETGGLDPSAANAGATLSLTTRGGGDQVRGSARLYETAASAEARERSANRVRSIDERGAEIGGPLRRGSVWGWAGVSRTQVLRDTFARYPIEIGLRHLSARAQVLWGATSASFLAIDSRKESDGRDANPGRAPETWWLQDSPMRIFKLEGSQLFGRYASLSAFFSRFSGDSSFLPRAGADAEPYWDGAIFRGSYVSSSRESVSSEGRVEGEFWTDRATRRHLGRTGVSWREQQDDYLETWGPRGLLHWSPEGWPEGAAEGRSLVEVIRPGRSLTAARAFGAWFSDVVASPRNTWHLGVRFDRQDGGAEGGQVAAHPAFPELLPAIEASERDAGFVWSSFSPRLGITHAFGQSGNLVARASLTRHAGQFHSGYLYRREPMSSEYVVSFEDGDGDQRYDPGEAYRIEGVYGVPEAAGADPWDTDPGLRPEVTDSLRLGLERHLGRRVRADLDLTWRSTSRILESRPLVRDAGGDLRLARREDYVFDTTVRGRLPGGREFEAPLYILASAVESTGATRLVNGDRRQQYVGATLSVVRPYSEGWMLRGHATVGDWRWRLGRNFRQHDDPTNAAAGTYLYGIGDPADDDGDVVVEPVLVTGARDGGYFINSRWSYSLAGAVQVGRHRPYGFTLAAQVYGREGFPLPYQVRVFGADGKSRWVQASPRVGSFRTDDVHLVDMRLEKDLPWRRLGARVSLDVFNLFDSQTVLQRSRSLTPAAAPVVAGSPLESLSPRVLRLGIRLSVGD